MNKFSTVRVKNKYIIIVILLVIISVGWAKAAGGDYLYNRAQTASNNNDTVKAFAYYDKLITEYPGHNKVPEALYWSASYMPQLDDFVAKIFPRHSSISRKHQVIDELPQGALSREERLWKLYKEYPDHYLNRHTPFLLGEILYEQGDASAEDFFLEALKSDGSRRADAAFKLIEVYLNTGRVDEALAIVDYSQTEIPDHLAEQMQIKRGDVLAALGERELAIEAYKKVLEIYQERSEESIRFYDSKQEWESAHKSTLEHYKQQVDSKIEILKAQETSHGIELISGQVTIGGDPLPGVTILINKLEQEGRWHSTHEENMVKQIADNKGTFSFEMAVGFYYEVGISLNRQMADKVEGYHLQIVDGEVSLQPGEKHFVEFRFVEPLQMSIDTNPDTILPLQLSWESYEGAAYYSASAQSITFTERGHTTTSSQLFTRVTDIEYIMDEPPSAVFGAYGGDTKGIFPTHLIGPLKGADALNIIIYAHDHNGSIISSSGGLYFGEGLNPDTKIDLSELTLTDEEQMIKERRYDEAVKGLEERLEQNPDDLRALKILAAIYFTGTYNLSSDWQHSEMAHQDIGKSRQLLERLVELYPSEDNMQALATVYSNLGLKEKRIEIYERMKDMGYDNWVVFNTLADHALRKEDDYLQALDYFAKSTSILRESSQGDGRLYNFQGYLGLLIATGQIEEAIDLLNDSIIRQTPITAQLRASLQAYANSKWMLTGKGDYIPTISSSYAKAKLAWPQGNAHGSFLQTISMLSDLQYHRHRDEIKMHLEKFDELYSKEAPKLRNIVKNLATHLSVWYE